MRCSANCCNWSFYENSELEEILARIQATLDPDERAAVLREGIDLVFADAALIWVYNVYQLVGMRSNVKGWEYNFMFGSNYAPFARMSLA